MCRREVKCNDTDHWRMCNHCLEWVKGWPSGGMDQKLCLVLFQGGQKSWDSPKRRGEGRTTLTLGVNRAWRWMGHEIKKYHQEMIIRSVNGMHIAHDLIILYCDYIYASFMTCICCFLVALLLFDTLSCFPILPSPYDSQFLFFVLEHTCSRSKYWYGCQTPTKCS